MVAETTDRAFVKRLEMDYEEVEFRWGCPRFSYQFKNEKKVVFLGPTQPNFALLALHELGHALCGHKDYSTHVQRLKIESEAWERAKTVLSKYQKTADAPEWDEDFVQSKMDTYRDWLHTQSRCKKCGLTRYQTENGEYHCPRCENFCLAY